MLRSYMANRETCGPRIAVDIVPDGKDGDSPIVDAQVVQNFGARPDGSHLNR